MPLIANLFTSPFAFILYIVALLIALTVHEAAHAWAAKKLGDDTAESLGRLTLNPLAHLDPIGTMALLFVGVGWGKPVPVNPNNFKHPKLDNLKVALAGPISNLILALIATAFYWVFRPDGGSLASDFTTTFVYLNLVLMFFNLIPLPPLDGSKLIHLFLDEESYIRFEQYGFYILLGLIALGWLNIPVLSNLIFTPTQFVFNLLLNPFYGVQSFL